MATWMWIGLTFAVQVPFQLAHFPTCACAARGRSCNCSKHKAGRLKGRKLTEFRPWLWIGQIALSIVGMSNVFLAIALAIARDVQAPDVVNVVYYEAVRVIPVVYITIPVVMALMFERGAFMLLVRAFWPYWMVLPVYVGGFTSYSVARLTDLSWGNRAGAGAEEASKLVLSTQRKGALILLAHLTANISLAFGVNFLLEGGQQKWALVGMCAWVIFPVHLFMACFFIGGQEGAWRRGRLPPLDRHEEPALRQLPKWQQRRHPKLALNQRVGALMKLKKRSPLERVLVMLTCMLTFVAAVGILLYLAVIMHPGSTDRNAADTPSPLNGTSVRPDHWWILPVSPPPPSPSPPPPCPPPASPPLSCNRFGWTASAARFNCEFDRGFATSNLHAAGVLVHQAGLLSSPRTPQPHVHPNKTRPWLPDAASSRSADRMKASILNARVSYPRSTSAAGFLLRTSALELAAIELMGTAVTLDGRVPEESHWPTGTVYCACPGGCTTTVSNHGCGDLRAIGDVKVEEDGDWAATGSRYGWQYGSSRVGEMLEFQQSQVLSWVDGSGEAHDRWHPACSAHVSTSDPAGVAPSALCAAAHG